MKKQDLIDSANIEITDALDELMSDECDLDVVEEHLKSALALAQSQPDDGCSRSGTLRQKEKHE